MFLLLCCVALFLNGAFSKEVTIRNGRLRGLVSNSRNGSEYNSFYSIPYAKPPVGNLCFMPPEEPENWIGTLDATILPPTCLQIDMLSSNHVIIGQEDCLYINVFTPTLNDDKLPVMVFIHGGGFLEGSGAMYRPNYIMDKKVVLVTFNYRLGILGFLSTGDSHISGNNGMKDQVAALRWVQKNIAAFGGDPTNVTIFGESAGSASVHAHLFSPMSKGLFHKAISQSGTAVASWAYIFPTVAHERMRTVALLTDCSRKDTEAIVQCLKEVPAEDFVNTQDKIHVFRKEPGVAFTLVIESNSDNNTERFLPVQPRPGGELDPKVPWITGINSAEGKFFLKPYFENNGSLLTKLNKNYEKYFPALLYYGYLLEPSEAQSLSKTLKESYFQNDAISIATVNQLEKLISDVYFTIPVVESVLYYEGTRYLYYFDHRNSQRFDKVLDKYPGSQNLSAGASHVEELQDLFMMFDLNEDDRKISDLLVTAWTNFAYNGNPNSNDLKDPNNQRVKWEPVKDDLEYLHITTNYTRMGTEFFKKKLEFFKTLRLKNDEERKKHFTGRYIILD